MTDIPEDSPTGDKEREYRRFYNSVFRDVPFILKAAYRAPLLLLIIVIALLVMLGAPAVTGFMFYTLMAVALGDTPASTWEGWIAVWFIGLAALGGAGTTLVVFYAFLTAILDAIKRTFGLLRGK